MAHQHDTGPRDMQATLQQFPPNIRAEIIVDADVTRARVKATGQQISPAGALEAVTALYVYLVEREWVDVIRMVKHE